MVHALDGPAFATRLDALMRNYAPEVVAVQLNLIGSHDAPRALTILGGDRRRDPPGDAAPADPARGALHLLRRRDRARGRPRPGQPAGVSRGPGGRRSGPSRVRPSGDRRSARVHRAPKGHGPDPRRGRRWPGLPARGRRSAGGRGRQRRLERGVDREPCCRKASRSGRWTCPGCLPGPGPTARSRCRPRERWSWSRADPRRHVRWLISGCGFRAAPCGRSRDTAPRPRLGPRRFGPRLSRPR